MTKEDYFKYYIQGSDHYLIPKDVFDELFDEMENWREDTNKYKEVIDRKKYLLKEQGAELKELYSEIDKLQGGIDKAIEYLEEPNRDSFDYSKAKLLDILNEVE